MDTFLLKCCYTVLTLLVVSSTTTATFYCPPGFVHNTTESNSTDELSCVCSEGLDGIIDCDEAKSVARIAIGFCMSFDYQTNVTIVGRCPYNSNYTLTDLDQVEVYVPLPYSVFELEEYFCGRYNRWQIFCSQCKDGFRSSMVSHSMECIPCADTYFVLGRFAYISMQMFVVTVIYILIIVFDIRFTKSPWSMFILFSQIVVNMLNYDRRLYSQLLYNTDGNVFSSFAVKIVLAFYGFFNLDFLPNLLPTFCLDIHVRGRHVLFYEYFAAIYPLFLIALIYFCVHLYSRDYKLVALPWRAVQYCINYQVCCGLKHILQRVSSQNIAHSFSSFLVLAFPRILFVSLDFLLPVQIYNLHGQIATESPALFHLPFKQYFGSTHLPYALVALFIFVVFSIVPTLIIILHPLCVSKCHCVNFLSVRLFVESFQGWLKDGTDPGTRDFRVLAGLHPVLRIMLAVSISLNIIFVRPLSPLANAQWLLPGVVFTCFSLLFALARPYKLQYMNTPESLLFAILGAISLLVSYRAGFYIALTLGATPMLVLVGYFVHKVLKKLKQYCSTHKCFQSRRLENENGQLANTEDFNADRLENPDAYLEQSGKQNSLSSVSGGALDLSVNIDINPASTTYGSI